jgi:FOG: TPR repeat, SEL1 subfamily
MTDVRTVTLVAICMLVYGLVPRGNEATAAGPQPLTPQAAQQFAADSEKAAGGDPDAAYRMGEAFESGRLGGMKDLNKALTYYRQAAKNGHEEAAARVTQIEAKLGINQKQKPAISQER